jgi:hypothetical protein
MRDVVKTLTKGDARRILEVCRDERSKSASFLNIVDKGVKEHVHDERMNL